MIEKIEELRAVMQAHSVGNLDVTLHGEFELRKARTGYVTSRFIALQPAAPIDRKSCVKGSGVQDSPSKGSRLVDPYRLASDIGTRRGGASIRQVLCERHRQRIAAVSRENAAQ